MKVIFAGGGTGGHLYPAISIAERLKKEEIDFHFMVSDRGIEAKILGNLGYDYTEQKVSAFMGQGLIGKIKAVFNMIGATFKALSFINKDDVVILTGGFAAAPSAFAAKLKGCKLYLHEQNSVMGLVNRTFAGLSTKVFLSFSDTKNAKGKTIVTGNPVRELFYNLPKKEGFDGRVLILGGSQGSRKINDLIVNNIDGLMDMGLHITHQTGAKLYDEVEKGYGEKLKKYSHRLNVVSYINNAPEEMAKADIIISRSGAGAVFEIRALNTPALYIPFASASENHQYYNALEVEKLGGCIILEEKDITNDKFLEDIKELKNNIDKYRNNLKNNPLPVSSEIILREAGLE